MNRSSHPFLTVRRRGASKKSRGATIVEVLVVLAILSVMTALVLPAVQRSREQARLLECRNHLKQILVGIHGFHDTMGALPADSSASWIGPARFPNMLSTFAHILPFLEQQVTYKRIDMLEDGFGAGLDPITSPRNAAVMQETVAAYRCPSDEAIPGASNYRVCRGVSPVTFGAAKFQGACFSYGDRHRARLSQIRDGLSQTALCSERMIGDRSSQRFTASQDVLLINYVADYSPDNYQAACNQGIGSSVPHVSFVGSTWLFSGYSQTWYNHVLQPNSRIPDCTSGGIVMSAAAVTARSWHNGGVNLAFADGAVRFQNEKVNLAIWRAIGTRSGGELH